ERCGAEVESKNLEQWLFRITAYADELLDEMESLESWPERVLTMQRNWIGRSEGAEVIFRVDGEDIDIPVFTTRPDTLFGATFFVLAPEHPLVPRLVAGTPPEEGAFSAHSEDERLVNSAQFSGLPSPEAKRAIVEWLESRHGARFAIGYRLRDWLLSRQRYWGCPIPIVHCGDCGMVPVPED